MVDTISPILEEFAPIDLSTDSLPTTPIYFCLSDSQSGVDVNSIMTVLNVEVNNILSSYNAIVSGVIQPGFSGSITSLGGSVDVFLTKDSTYGSSAKVEVQLQAQDEANIINETFDFQVRDVTPPSLSSFVPSIGQVNVLESSSIAFMLSDANQSGIDLSSVQVTINGNKAIENGVVQGSFLDTGLSNVITTLIPSTTLIATALYLLIPLNDLPSAQFTTISILALDNQGNKVSRSYNFRVRDYKSPTIENLYPNDGYEHILPQTDIRFDLVEDPDGYGINFSTLTIEIDGYSISDQRYLGTPVDGYNDDYISRYFSQASIDGYIITPPVYDAYNNLTYPGFYTTIKPTTPGRYEFVVNPDFVFPFNYFVTSSVYVEDLGGNFATFNFSFTTAAEDDLITTAYPDTNTYKNFIDGYGVLGAAEFLVNQGVELTNNFPDGYTIIYYTTDGSQPRIDSSNKVIGTTKVYTQPILINKEGLNVIKYFSIDLAGNREDVKQDIYIIDIIPPEIQQVRFTRIVADIPLLTAIIPVEDTDLFEGGELVRILDDARPPILTKILTINKTSSPPFLIVEDQVQKLKVSRNARVEKTEQLLDPLQSIQFDTANIPEYFYIGSDGFGQNQADSVFEQFRILNRASTDEEILADFTLLDKGVKFFNQEEPVVLSSQFSELEKQRVNLPNNTLVLLDMDGTVVNTPRQGTLINNSIPIVDVSVAANDIVFTIKIKKSENVDRELLRQVLTNFAPVDLNIIVDYIEID
jgi:hypothetical protein